MWTRDPPIRRPSSSAETSIDEETADQLLADDFRLPASPTSSRPGGTSYARPTSSAFEPHHRPTSSAASSQHPQSVISQPPPGSPISEFASVPPALGQLNPAVSLIVRPDSAVDSVSSSHGNPFVDPIEPASPSPMAEKPVKTQADARQQQVAQPIEKAGKSRKRLIILVLSAVSVILALVLIPVGILVIKPKSNSDPSNHGLQPPRTKDPASLGIPPSADGTVLDSTKWLDWTDFNVTYTDVTVGGLSIMVFHSRGLRLTHDRG